MATFNKYNDFVEQLGLKIHNLNTDTLKVALFTSTHVPAATDTSYSSLTNEVLNGNGYTTGGEDATAVWTESPAGTGSLSGTDVTWTATGAVNNIRYVVLYNATAVGKNLIGYWDNGSAVSLSSGETFKVDFGTTILTIT